MKALTGLLFLLVLGWPSGALTFTDGTGHVVEVPEPPAAVGSLSLMTDEFLAALVVPDRIKAFSRFVDDPVLSNALDAGKTVKSRLWTNLEVVISLRPDLILAPDWVDSGDMDFLRKKGFAVYIVKTPRTWAEVKVTVRELGAVLGVPDRAKVILAGLTSREKVLEKRRGRIHKPVTVLEYNSFGASMGTGTLWSDLLTLAGVVNAAAALPVNSYGYAALSTEMLVKLDPDWLVLPSQGALDSYGQKDFLTNLQADPLFRTLRAVQSGHVLFLSEALKTTTSQAALGAAEAIQYAAYPDLR